MRMQKANSKIKHCKATNLLCKYIIVQGVLGYHGFNQHDPQLNTIIFLKEIARIAKMPHPRIKFQGRNLGNFWLAFWAKWWPHKFILNLTDLYKSQTNLIFWHSFVNIKITFKSQNLYHFKTPPPLLSVPLVARERKVSFSPHKSHLESFFFLGKCVPK